MCVCVCVCVVSVCGVCLCACVCVVCVRVCVCVFSNSSKCDVTSRASVRIYSERYIWTEESQTNEQAPPIQVQKNFFSLKKNVSMIQQRYCGFMEPT